MFIRAVVVPPVDICGSFWSITSDDVEGDSAGLDRQKKSSLTCKHISFLEENVAQL